MKHLTRAALLQLTPSRYLESGYFTDTGGPRPQLLSLFATAASEQLLRAELSPQELAFTAEAIRQLLPVCKGSPAARLASAIAQARPLIERTIGQASNPGLAAWLDACAAVVVTQADLGAFLEHVIAVQRQYRLIVGIVASRE